MSLDENLIGKFDLVFTQYYLIGEYRVSNPLSNGQGH